MSSLSERTAARMLSRLGLSGPPGVTLDGLNQLYRAWCLNVPFDNLRKRIALAEGGEAPLPGGEPEDFCRHYLEHGTGGTCWPGSNALFALLAGCGFDMRRVSASMGENGETNHGSAIARLASGDYLVDSSILCNVVLPLRSGETFQSVDPVHLTMVRPVEGSFRIRFARTKSNETHGCRLLEDPVDESFYLQRYERSRSESPFNETLYVRRNREGSVLTVSGRRRHDKDAAGLRSRDLTLEDVQQALERELGISRAMIERSLALDLL